tara:strand:- start:963 stop:1262 length:300 start_codon:yes stop_codon:yes gene_type:complete
MRPVAFDMPWSKIVQSSHGIIIIRTDDCLNCIELEAQLENHDMGVPLLWINRKDAKEIFQQFPIFSAAVDVLPFAGIFSHGECIKTVRAATIKRLEDAL